MSIKINVEELKESKEILDKEHEYCLEEIKKSISKENLRIE